MSLMITHQARVAGGNARCAAVETDLRDMEKLTHVKYRNLKMILNEMPSSDQYRSQSTTNGVHACDPRA